MQKFLSRHFGVLGIIVILAMILAAGAGAGCARSGG